MRTDSARRASRWLRRTTVTAALATALPAAPQVMDSMPHWLVLVDQLELAPNRDGTPASLDLLGWYGGDVNRLWVRAEAEQALDEDAGGGQVEALYGRLIAPFWDVLVGIRVDPRWGGGPETRAHLALGLAGLAPFWFELEPTLYLSHEGDVSAQLEAEYDLFVTQRAVLQPRLELQAAVQEVPELGIGSGLTDLELGARLRYEVRRAVAPYLGVAWHRQLGETADLARAAGEDVSRVSIVAGLRLWY